jgi:hypothetical protein
VTQLTSQVLPQEAEDDAFIAGQGMGNLNFAEGFEEFDLADMVVCLPSKMRTSMLTCINSWNMAVRISQ